MAKISNDDLQELLVSAERMLSATNELWLANNPDELNDETPMDPDEATELHSECFYRLKKAIHTARRRSTLDETT